jgi:mRNA interferase MazF
VKPPHRGEVWLVDLGLAAKIRPCLVLSVPAAEADRSLVTVVPHTTSLRGTRYVRTLMIVAPVIGGVRRHVEEARQWW